MDAVILMVSRENEPAVFDVEVMPNIPAEELAEAVANALNWTGQYEVEIGTTGRRLAANQTLADAEIWDGALLRLVRSSRPPRSSAAQTTMLSGQSQQIHGASPSRPIKQPDAPAQAPASPPVNPVVGWRQPDRQDDKRAR